MDHLFLKKSLAIKKKLNEIRKQNKKVLIKALSKKFSSLERQNKENLGKNLNIKF